MTFRIDRNRFVLSPKLTVNKSQFHVVVVAIILFKKVRCRMHKKIIMDISFNISAMNLQTFQLSIDWCITPKNMGAKLHARNVCFYITEYIFSLCELDVSLWFIIEVIIFYKSERFSFEYRWKIKLQINVSKRYVDPRWKFTEIQNEVEKIFNLTIIIEKNEHCKEWRNNNN